MVPCCPHCRESHVRRSRRQFYDLPLRILGFVAFRCTMCGARFYRFRGRDSEQTVS